MKPRGVAASPAEQAAAVPDCRPRGGAPDAASGRLPRLPGPSKRHGQGPPGSAHFWPHNGAAARCAGDKMRFLGTDGAGKLGLQPQNTVHQLKRILGKKFKDPMVGLQYMCRQMGRPALFRQPSAARSGWPSVWKLRQPRQPGAGLTCPPSTDLRVAGSPPDQHESQPNATATSLP
jgi:hypothetical protein